MEAIILLNPKKKLRHTAEDGDGERGAGPGAGSKRGLGLHLLFCPVERSRSCICTTLWSWREGHQEYLHTGSPCVAPKGQEGSSVQLHSIYAPGVIPETEARVQ